MNELVPIGIVGAGRSRDGLGPFLAEFLELEGFVVRGVSGRSLQRATTNAEAVGTKLRHDVKAFASPAALCASGIAGLVIASPVEFHLEALRAAVEAGLPALCEKPLVHESHAREGAELIEDFARKRLPLLENCQWPYVLPALEQLHGPVATGEYLTVELGLGPGRSGREMVRNTVSHLLSLIQAVGSIDPDAVVSEVSIADPSYEQRRNLLRFCIAASPGRMVEGLLHLEICPVGPRPAWLAINGRRIDRRVLPGYTLAFSANGIEVTVPDPTKELVKRFALSVRSRDSGLMAEDSDRIRQRLNWYEQILAQLR